MKQLIALSLIAASALHADFIEKTFTYVFEETTFEATVVYAQDTAKDASLPGILMVPYWMGPGERATERARLLADDEFAVFVVDMYGVDIRPNNASEAGAAAGFVRGDRALMRRRAQEAVNQFAALSGSHPIDGENILAIGFCFGGGTVLELARSGTKDVKGVVSFHGNLDTPDPAIAQNIQVPVMVLHGADDPYVPKEQVNGFEEEMRAAGVDWQLVSYGGAVHSFTNPYANNPGASIYHERTAKRAYEKMDEFAEEVMGLDD